MRPPDYSTPDGGVRLTEWHNCYEGGWQSLIVPEAFAHPAKMSYALLVRIIRHGLDSGFWSPGMLLGDPFGGIGSTGIVASYYGLRTIAVELEQRFVDLAQENFALHKPRWEVSGDPQPVLVQGDSRRFAEIVGEVCGCVTSPPFSIPGSQPVGNCPSTPVRSKLREKGIDDKTEYGFTPGQIGQLPAGSIDGVISSPPYAETDIGAQEKRDGAKRLQALQRAKDAGKPLGRESVRVLEKGLNANTNLNAEPGGYGVTPGQIGALSAGTVDGVVTSPPFADSGATLNVEGNCRQVTAERAERRSEKVYGTTVGQVGELSGETYWQAMLAVYAQMHAAMKPGAVAAIVCKDYVKAGKRVPLCDDTCRLLESLGFQVFERVHAMLVRETKHPSLFGGEETSKTERKSFFRRLAEKKGSPPIDYEEVIWCRSRESGRGS